MDSIGIQRITEERAKQIANGDSVQKLVGDVFELGWMHKQMGEAWHGKEEYENRIRHAALVEKIRGLELEWKGAYAETRLGTYVSYENGYEWWDFYVCDASVSAGNGGRLGALADYRSRAAQMFGIDAEEVCGE